MFSADIPIPPTDPGDPSSFASLSLCLSSPLLASPVEKRSRCMNEIGPGMKTARMNGERRPKAFSRGDPRECVW